MHMHNTQHTAWRSRFNIKLNIASGWMQTSPNMGYSWCLLPCACKQQRRLFSLAGPCMGCQAIAASAEPH